MPKCQWVITKGTKKDTECGIYTKKKYGGKYYCASHLKMKEVLYESEESSDLDDVEEKPEKESKPKTKSIVNDKPKEKPKEQSKEKPKEKPKEKTLKEKPQTEKHKEKPGLDKHSVDEIIEFEYQEALQNEN